jgi:hypothetical protein
VEIGNLDEGNLRIQEKQCGEKQVLHFVGMTGIVGKAKQIPRAIQLRFDCITTLARS